MRIIEEICRGFKLLGDVESISTHTQTYINDKGKCVVQRNNHELKNSDILTTLMKSLKTAKL
ncbi:MAG: hypothetical protein AB1422_00715 [bacterium]